MPNFDAEEKEILAAFAAGQLQQAPDRAKKLADHQQVAEATLDKTLSLNIALSSQDLKALESNALQKGISTQALISHLLQQYLAGQRIEKR